MRENLERLKNNIEVATHQYLDALVAAQSACKHQRLAECSFRGKTDYNDAAPPIRVCLDCGMSEEGGDPGYVVLTGAASPISREQLRQHCAGLHIANGHKGPLVRGETTVARLIDDFHRVGLFP